VPLSVRPFSSLLPPSTALTCFYHILSTISFSDSPLVPSNSLFVAALCQPAIIFITNSLLASPPPLRRPSSLCVSKPAISPLPFFLVPYPFRCRRAVEGGGKRVVQETEVAGLRRSRAWSGEEWSGRVLRSRQRSGAVQPVRLSASQRLCVRFLPSFASRETFIPAHEDSASPNAFSLSPANQASYRLCCSISPSSFPSLRAFLRRLELLLLQPLHIIPKILQEALVVFRFEAVDTPDDVNALVVALGKEGVLTAARPERSGRLREGEKGRQRDSRWG
jgi:hypothetical protein